MGAELLIPAAIAALGSGAQYVSQRNALKEQDEAAAQGIRTQAGHQREADARVAQEVSALENSSPEAAQRSATDAFMDQLKRTRAQAHGANQVGAVSDAFASDSAAATAGIDKAGAGRAGVLGRINAPGLQRQGETVSRLRAGSDLGLIGRASAGDQFLAQLRQQSIRPNPWLEAGGQILTGVGSGMAANGGYGAGKPKPKMSPTGAGTQYGSARGFA